MRKTLLLSGFFLYCLTAYGQKATSNNTLLWRISGKGLNAPSYLYGTIHLTDKKIFHLGDSLYAALERTEGFAALRRALQGGRLRR